MHAPATPRERSTAVSVCRAISTANGSGAKIHAVGGNGRNALHRASAVGEILGAVETVRLLLDAGFAPDEADPHGWRALTLTSHPGIASLRLERGAVRELSADEERRLGTEEVARLRALLDRA
jgi:hypothetical protein